MGYKISTTFKKINDLRKPIRVIQGGKGSSKTISILQLFIFIASSKKRNLILSIVGSTIPNLKGGAIRDFEKILRSYGMEDSFKSNKEDKTYTHKVTGNIIEFFSADNVHSRLGSRRTHLYVNEADILTLEVFLELVGRTHEFTLVDYNPRYKFWIHREIIGQPNADFLIVDYTDNEYLPQGEIDNLLWIKSKAYHDPNIEDYDQEYNIKSTYWVNMWRVLGLGQLGVAEGVIFHNYTTATTVPQGAKYLGLGLDFGFSNDPTAAVKLYRHEDKIVLEQVLLRTGLLNPKIYDILSQDRQIARNVIIADGAEPKTIEDLKQRGLAIKACTDKSRADGIHKMQEQEFIVVGEELIKQFSTFRWDKDKHGVTLNVPALNQVDDLMDASKYAVMDLVKGQQQYNTLRSL